MAQPHYNLRRSLGISFLVLAVAMLFWGETLLKPHLEGRVFVYYWLTCFVETGLAILMALLDFRAIRLESQKEHRQLIHSTLHQLEEDMEEKGGHSEPQDNRQPKS